MQYYWHIDGKNDENLTTVFNFLALCTLAASFGTPVGVFQKVFKGLSIWWRANYLKVGGHVKWLSMLFAENFTALD